jgi:ubiquinone/menaquinone biosynthesis C-methylase UbiE
MSTNLHPKVTDYFSRDDAAAQWWNVDYDTRGRYGRQLAFVRRHLKLAGQRALDIATGRGRFAVEYAKLGAAQVTGVDISAAMVTIAAQNAERLGVADRTNFLVGNASELNLTENYYDLVSLMEVLVHLPDPKEAIASAVRHLKPGGLFITNYDLPIAPKVTYPIDTLVSFVRGLLKGKKRDVVMYDTVDETMNALDRGERAARVTRPRDAYRGLDQAEVNAILTDLGLEIVETESEFAYLLSIPIPITIGYLVLARKRR